MTGTNKLTSDIFNQHYSDLKLSLLKEVNDSVLIEDILQDAFLRFHLNVENGKKIHNPKAWLYRVSKNLLMDHFRVNKKTSINLPQNIEDNISPLSHGPEDCLMGIIQSLPKKYKEAVYLSDIKGIPQTVSAKKLNISLSTFKSHVQRGRKLVANGYVECCDYRITENGELKGEIKNWGECKICSSS